MPESMLLEILRQRSARTILSSTPKPDPLGGEVPVFPFLSIVGQVEMKTALVLSVINPAVGGVLLIGPRGTGKTTAVRGLADLMPPVQHSQCPYGCEEEAARAWGMDAICSDCAAKLERGEDLTKLEPMRLIELPLNARLEDVIGGINERVAVEQQRVRLERGILSYAHRNMLYIDEVNLLEDMVMDSILDAAAQARVTVRRGPLKAVYPSELVLVGSMNPEEGALRPQMQDRFGLRVIVDGLVEPRDRLEVYRRVRSFREYPYRLAASLAEDTIAFGKEIAQARALLPEVELSPEAERVALETVQALEISSLRAEIVTLEAARAYAAADGRRMATANDVSVVAWMSLRQRRSPFMADYLKVTQAENGEISATLNRSMEG